MAERVKWVWMLMLMVALLGCGPEDAATVADAERTGDAPTEAADHVAEGGPYDREAQMRAELMRVEPAVARAGAEAELHFPERTSRGQAFVIEARVGDSWQHRYWLIAVPAGVPVTPRWTPVGERFDWDDIEIVGPGPDRIVVPDTAEAGQYRVCTANAGSNFCAELTVAE